MSQQASAFPFLLEMADLAAFDFASFLSRNGLSPQRVRIITGARYSQNIARKFARRIQRLTVEVIAKAENSQAFHLRLCGEAVEADGTDTLVIGIGGGGVLDVAKYHASELGHPYLAIPTVISNDGIASPIAILRNATGVMESYSTAPPVGTLIDLEILSNAPSWSLANGLGDVFSNHSAVLDWDLAVKNGRAEPNALARIMSRSAVQSVLPSTPSLRDPGFLERYINAIVLSGLAMFISGDSRPCSGAEHLIAHVITRDHPFRYGHGFLVGSIAPFIVWLHDPNDRALVDVSKYLGLQLSFADLFHRDQSFASVMDSARTIRGPRFTILDQRSNRELEAEYRRYVQTVAVPSRITPQPTTAMSSAQ